MPDKDVLGKADALLRRHSLPLPGSGGETGGVPVLTELIEPTPAPAPQAPSPDLGRAILERVMQDVEGRLATDIEKRIAQHLAPQIQAAVASAIGELRQELAATIGAAVRQELERRHVK